MCNRVKKNKLKGRKNYKTSAKIITYIRRTFAVKITFYRNEINVINYFINNSHYKQVLNKVRTIIIYH